MRSTQTVLQAAGMPAPGEPPDAPVEEGLECSTMFIVLAACVLTSQLVPACLQTIVRDRRHTPLDVKKLDVHLHYITGALERGNVS